MMKDRFQGNFTQQEPIPESSIDSALSVLRSGRLHRYNNVSGEVSETALLEKEFAAWQGSEYCLAVASGGQAMQIALRSAGIKHGDSVLTNAFTLAPVPGAIDAVGANTIFVEINKDLHIDIDDLENKASIHSAKILLLSKMRGHMPNMDEVMRIANKFEIVVIEDCAHSMGSRWRSKRSGNFGLAGCFSTQTYKHINSGEGGLIVSSDPEFIARATFLSGSYMLYDRHGAGPEKKFYQNAQYDTANHSARMDNLRAAVLRPQLLNLQRNIQRWNDLYDELANKIITSPRVKLPKRFEEAETVGSSLQFRVPDMEYEDCERFINKSAERGVELKWFGRKEPSGFTSAHTSWHYLQRQNLPKTDAILKNLFDIRLPLSFSVEDCKTIGRIILETLE